LGVGEYQQYDDTATSLNAIKIHPLPITTVSPGSGRAWVYIRETTEGIGNWWGLRDFFVRRTTHITINTASIKFRGVQPEVRELRLIPITNLGFS
jgi:hypothetical protein